ncbi:MULTISPECIES: hypothetical protein [unclassified Methanoregula]|uniref:hypothetical protein n=1 Tax=unclassified Methanoregula TaxID=2649730 RepID=UPI0009D4011E|nr:MULTISPECIES: hypothetical protein [unclassified Methanoregula]OPX65264.1 MAG: hypothetical protein A4E33_00297 [Methanoregula sp. PtaB.Bin085]OPY32173.1 MAG: hypothetical protein A4E34_02547 [Methanoregula sp. PtaU1.Bin006]
MMNPALIRFKTEIANFYRISLINLVFAALAIAYGISYIITAVLGSPLGLQAVLLRLVTGAAALACFGLGLSWLLSTLRIFEGVETIRDALSASGEEVSEERLTCLIVRMLAHYRDNRDTIRTMILVSTAGGCVFFVLSITSGIRALSLTANSGSATFESLVLLPSMLLTLGIALVSLISSYYFSRFAGLWDRRLHEIGESECTLKKTLERDEA